MFLFIEMSNSDVPFILRLSGDGKTTDFQNNCASTWNLTSFWILQSLPTYVYVCCSKEWSRTWLSSVACNWWPDYLLVFRCSYQCSNGHISIIVEPYVILLFREMSSSDVPCINRLSGYRKTTFLQGICAITWKLTSCGILQSLAAYYMSVALRNLLPPDFFLYRVSEDLTIFNCVGVDINLIVGAFPLLSNRL